MEIGVPAPAPPPEPSPLVASEEVLMVGLSFVAVPLKDPPLVTLDDGVLAGGFEALVLPGVFRFLNRILGTVEGV